MINNFPGEPSSSSCSSCVCVLVRERERAGLLCLFKLSQLSGEAEGRLLCVCVETVGVGEGCWAAFLSVTHVMVKV